MEKVKILEHSFENLWIFIAPQESVEV